MDRRSTCEDQKAEGQRLGDCIIRFGWRKAQVSDEINEIKEFLHFSSVILWY